jgi:sugar phosphate isomerase/epimerase
MDEVRPGLGVLDYPTLLSELEQVDHDMPLIVEHLKTDEEFTLGMEFIRKTAKTVNVEL